MVKGMGENLSKKLGVYFYFSFWKFATNYAHVVSRFLIKIRILENSRFLYFTYYFFGKGGVKIIRKKYVFKGATP